jgi:DNA-binding CsgD family transcriptional regulator
MTAHDRYVLREVLRALDPMERLVLHLTAAGKGQREIARTIGRSRASVRHWQRKARRSVEVKWPQVASWLFGGPGE